MTTATWYVLVEEDTRTTRNAEGVVLKLHRWTLTASHPVTGPEEEALTLAEHTALHHMPSFLAAYANPGDTPARQAFLTPDGTWLVHLQQRHRACHIRVSTARLIHTQEETQAPQPQTLKTKLRQALKRQNPQKPPKNH
ncbi:hypothetical protein [Streptomyces subrutilus]|uniref:hypothetical protein n=1 Tax=Streptomyces subrutilus TaxID=36818 RepID=UPI0033DFB607